MSFLLLFFSLVQRLLKLRCFLSKSYVQVIFNNMLSRLSKFSFIFILGISEKKKEIFRRCSQADLVIYIFVLNQLIHSDGSYLSKKAIFNKARDFDFIFSSDSFNRCRHLYIAPLAFHFGNSPYLFLYEYDKTSKHSRGICSNKTLQQSSLLTEKPCSL